MRACFSTPEKSSTTPAVVCSALSRVIGTCKQVLYLFWRSPFLHPFIRTYHSISSRTSTFPLRLSADRPAQVSFVPPSSWCHAVMPSMTSRCHFQEAETTALEAPSDQDLRVPCYCEENVWRLAYRKLKQEAAEQSTAPQQPNSYHVLFVSNPRKCVPFFHQRAVGDPNKACFWDYHVILLCTDPHGTTVVLDIDSRLAYGCRIEDYLDETFPPHLPNDFQPMFRVIEARLFLKHFSSDRMHMFNPKTQQWNAPPPTYSCIQATGDAESNLMKYVDMIHHTNDDKLGVVLTFEQLRQRFL